MADRFSLYSHLSLARRSCILKCLAGEKESRFVGNKYGPDPKIICGWGADLCLVRDTIPNILLWVVQPPSYRWDRRPFVLMVLLSVVDCGLFVGACFFCGELSVLVCFCRRLAACASGLWKHFFGKQLCRLFVFQIRSLKWSSLKLVSFIL